jgi:hypothetical protein
MGWNDDAWKDSYDAWKLQTPPEYEWPDGDGEDDGEMDEDAWLDLLSQEEASDG